MPNPAIGNPGFAFLRHIAVRLRTVAGAAAGPCRGLAHVTLFSSGTGATVCGHRMLRYPFLAMIAWIGPCVGFAQEPPPPPPPAEAMPVTQPAIHGVDPLPEPAIRAIYAAYTHYDVVAMDAAHGNQNLDNFILELLGDPQFPGKINDIVVECGNSLYQPVLDRYISGKNVELAEIEKVWRDTTQPMCAVSSFYAQLFPLIRRLNQRLPPDRRVRVLAGDVPINWAVVRTRNDLLHAPQDRDGTIASIMEKEVLSKHRKALMLFGTDHLYHGAMPPLNDLSAVARYEKRYPGVTFVIADHTGFGNQTPYARFNDEFESRMKSWPIPSLVPKLAGTWLADVLNKTESAGVVTAMHQVNGKVVTQTVAVGGGRKFETMVDGYLYLGPRDLLLGETVPANVLLDKKFMAEMRRRAVLMQMPSVTDQADPDKVEAAGYEPFFDPNGP